MKIHYGLDSFEATSKVVLTTGTFDGVHLGHKKIIERLTELSKKLNGESVLLTFTPHPRLVLFPENNDLRLLNTQEEKNQLLAKSGIDHLIIHPFTREFSRLSSLEFVRDLLVNQANIHTLVIGYNHHFGRNREGGYESLEEFAEVFGFHLEEIPAEDLDNVNISSTKVRAALEEGNASLAKDYLGYEYSLTGKVVEGNKIGRSLGYPTANLEVQDRNKLVPCNGVYAVKVSVGPDEYKGMLNIGFRPTVNGDVGKRTIEVHLLDFEGDLYGREITVRFVKRIREEREFESVERLKEQLNIDFNNTQQIFR